MRSGLKYKFTYQGGNYEKIKEPSPLCTFSQLILGMTCKIRVTITILKLEELLIFPLLLCLKYGSLP